MKFIIIIGLSLLISVPSLSQHNPEKMNYLAKSEKYKRMKHTGMTLTLVGSVLFVVGYATLLNSTNYNSQTGSNTATSGAEQGALATLLGMAGLGTGIPFWIVGAHNEKKYMNKFEAVTLHFNAVPHGAGLTLAYRF